MELAEILRMIANGVKIAAATANNDLVKKGAGVMATVAEALALGADIDGEIAERAREFAQQVRDDIKIDEDDFEKVASDLSSALEKWNAAG